MGEGAGGEVLKWRREAAGGEVGRGGELGGSGRGSWEGNGRDGKGG